MDLRRTDMLPTPDPPPTMDRNMAFLTANTKISSKNKQTTKSSPIFFTQFLFKNTLFNPSQRDDDIFSIFFEKTRNNRFAVISH